MAVVLVTDAALGSAVSIIRSLGRHGHRVIAAASDVLAPGHFSRYTAVRHRYPNAREDPDGAVEDLLDAVDRHHVDVLIPVSDEILLPLAHARGQRHGACRIMIPDLRTLTATVDKAQTINLARSVDVATPRTAVCETAEQALDAAGDFGWPVVVKPRSSYLYSPGSPPRRRHVRYAFDEHELRAGLRDDPGEVLIQEHVSGEGGAVCLLMHDGRPLAAFQYRRLREVPLSGGASSFRESMPLECEPYQAALRLLGAIGWTGLAMVEFRMTANGAVLMEINGRVWGSLPLAVASGMNFPVRAVDLVLHGPPPEETPVALRYRVGVRSRDLALERAWVAQVLGRRQNIRLVTPPARRRGVAVAARMLVPGGFDVRDARDPVPGLAETVKVGLAAIRR